MLAVHLGLNSLYLWTLVLVLVLNDNNNNDRLTAFDPGQPG